MLASTDILKQVNHWWNKIIKSQGPLFLFVSSEITICTHFPQKMPTVLVKPSKNFVNSQDHLN